jgi:hypothetical protein
MPPPIPKIALIIPRPAGIRSRGNVSRDDPEGQRKDAARDALQHAPGDDDAERAAERADDRAAREHQQDSGEHAALAVEVAELADDRRRDRGGQQERRQQPRDGGRARVQRVADLRQRRDHERLRERERHARHEQHEQHLVRVRGGSGARDGGSGHGQ